MIKDIEKIMGEIAEGSDTVLVNPATLEELKQQGIQFDSVPPPTIEQLFEQRKQNAISKVKALPLLPQGLEPAIQALYQEIIECIFFGLNGAAITMSSILIEYTLKHTTYIKESGSYQKADPNKWDEFENMEFGPAINRAKKAGLIDSKMSIRIHPFRETVRNLYIHYNIRKITQNVIWKNVKKFDSATGKVETIDVAVRDNPAFQPQAKNVMDEEFVWPVLYFADEVVKYLLPQITNI